MFRGWGVTGFLLFLSFSLAGCDLIGKAELNTDDNTIEVTEIQSGLDAENASAVPESVAIHLCDSVITTNTTCTVTATAIFKDGSTKVITSEVSWSVEGGNATINANGSLSAGDTAGTVTVSASYNTISGSVTVTVKQPAGATTSPQSSSSSSGSTKNESSTGSSGSTSSGGDGTSTSGGSTSSGSNTNTNSPSFTSFDLSPAVNGEIWISAGEAFTVTAIANYDDNSIKDVSQAVVWSWNSTSLELRSNTSNEFISKPITSKLESIDLTGNVQLDDGTDHTISLTVKIAFVDYLTYWHGKADNTINILNDAALDLFNDPSGLTATSLSFGGWQAVPGMVVSSVTPDQTLMLVYNDATNLSYAFLKVPVVDSVNSTVSVEQYVWYPDINSVAATADSSIATVVGGISTGSFALTFCKKDIVDLQGDCNVQSNQRAVAGNFNIVRTADHMVNSAPVSQATALTTDQNYSLAVDETSQTFALAVEPKLDYEFVLNGTDVLMSVVGLDNCQQVKICQVTARPDLVSRQLFFSVSSTNNTAVSFSISMSDKGFSPGTAALPVSLGSGPVKYPFIIKAGESHYYSVDLTAANNYWMTVRAINLGPLNMSVYSDSGFTTAVCADITECETGGYDKIYVKIDNTDINDDTFEFRLVYNFENTPDTAELIQNFTINSAVATFAGQVGPKHNGIGDATAPEGSFYGFIPNAGRKYEISISGMQNQIELYVNTSFGGASGGISPCSVLIDASDERVSCIVETLQNWVTLNFVSRANAGTPFTIDIRELAIDEKVYQVDLGRVNNYKLGYPFATVLSKEGKVLFRRKFRTWVDSISPGADLVDFVMPPGDDYVFIRVSDVYRAGEQYAIRIVDDGSKGFSAYPEVVNDPDPVEPGDNEMSGATPILYGTDNQQVHDFGVMPDGSGDIDWFKFCTNAAACGL